jgi:hypothetical protein
VTVIHVPLTCPGCGARLSLMAEDEAPENDGALVCEHGHVFDVSDPDDDRELQSKLGPAYRTHLHAA